MAYRNRHRIGRSDQVWNRDLMNSDEETYSRRARPSAYSPGYSSRNIPSVGNRNSNNNNDDRYGNRDYDRRYNDNRYDSDYDNDYNRHYDYDSGRLRDEPDYDRYNSGRRYEDDYYDRYSTDNRRYNDDDRGWWDRTRDEVASWFGDDDAEKRREMDRRQSHRGKGPKGYQRSDDRIREDINDRLSDDDWVDASDVELEVNNSEVILKGSVTTKSEKRRAEDIAESVSGVRHVENRLRVTEPNSVLNMDRYTGTTGEHYGLGSSSGTTSEIQRDVERSRRY